MKLNPVVACAMIVHDDVYAFGHSLSSALTYFPTFVVVGRNSWCGPAGDCQSAAAIAEQLGAFVVRGHFSSQTLQRAESIVVALQQTGATHVVFLDAEEVMEPALAHSLLELARSDIADRVYARVTSHWKTATWSIQPEGAALPLVMANLTASNHVRDREFVGGRTLRLESSDGRIHHYGWCGSDDRIRRKLETWHHPEPVVNGWYENVWRAWDSDPLLMNLHPSEPASFHRAIATPPPDCIHPEFPADRTSTSSLAVKPSIVIPLYGGRADIAECLAALGAYRGNLQEVIVVDNGSPDGAADLVAEQHPWVKLIRLPENIGYGPACNAGFRASASEIVVFLNSDTVVPEPGLAMLIQSLLSDNSIAAAGPYTNYAGYGQQIVPGYATIGQLNRFATTFAYSDRSDEDTDMLVGFCLAVRRECFEAIGGFDEQFGIGTWEDNDVCYALRRLGYRLVRSGRAYIHHHGSRTFGRMDIDCDALYEENQLRFVTKWRSDLDSGFSSGLSGLSETPIRFQHGRTPEVPTSVSGGEAHLKD